VTVGGVERFLVDVAQNSGKGAAKMSRTVLRGVLDLATKHDANPANPVRSAGPIKVRTTKPTGTRDAERDAVIAYADTDPIAARRDLADFVAFLAGTGARIGEVCALRWSALDLAEGTARLGPVVVRETGKGLHIQDDGKTEHHQASSGPAGPPEGASGQRRGQRVGRDVPLPPGTPARSEQHVP
jgi:integrase